MKIKTHFVVGSSGMCAGEPGTLKDLATAKIGTLHKEETRLLLPMLKGQGLSRISHFKSFVKPIHSSNS